MKNPTETVLLEQYEQAEEEYSGTLGAYMQLIRESWHLHEDEADEHMQSRVWDPGGSRQALRVIDETLRPRPCTSPWKRDYEGAASQRARVSFASVNTEQDSPAFDV